METCPVCHQPILSQYYFCPNCGAKIKEAPLSTTLSSQILLYAHSIILPLICFITVSKWSGRKYFKSNDPKAKQIGMVAWGLLTISTIIVIWLAYIWTQQMIQAQLNAINVDFGGL